MTCALLGCISTASFAQKKVSRKHAAAHKEVPVVQPTPEVQSAFDSKVSGATPTWSKSAAGSYIAVTDNSGQKQYTEFAPDGKWLRTRTDLPTNQLPDSAKTAIQTQYPGMDIAAIQKLEYENVSGFYKVDLKQGSLSKSVWVNGSGNIKE